MRIDYNHSNNKIYSRNLKEAIRPFSTRLVGGTSAASPYCEVSDDPGGTRFSASALGREPLVRLVSIIV